MSLAAASDSTGSTAGACTASVPVWAQAEDEKKAPKAASNIVLRTSCMAFLSDHNFLDDEAGWGA